MIECGAQVTQGLSRDPKTAATLLHSKGFVSDRLLEEITDLNVTWSDNGQKLYIVMQYQIVEGHVAAPPKHNTLNWKPHTLIVHCN